MLRLYVPNDYTFKINGELDLQVFLIMICTGLIVYHLFIKQGLYPNFKFKKPEE